MVVDRIDFFVSAYLCNQKHWLYSRSSRDFFIEYVRLDPGRPVEVLVQFHTSEVELVTRGSRSLLDLTGSRVSDRVYIRKGE